MWVEGDRHYAVDERVQDNDHGKSPDDWYRVGQYGLGAKDRRINDDRSNHRTKKRKQQLTVAGIDEPVISPPNTTPAREATRPNSPTTAAGTIRLVVRAFFRPIPGWPAYLLEAA
jgi:hypothetical protein